jgi:hypothetical protein
MRVVADPTAADRRGNATAVDGSAETVATTNGTALATAGGAGASGKGLPLLPVALFLLACTAAGALVAVLRPLGLG